MKKWLCDLCENNAHPGEGGYAKVIEMYDEEIQVDVKFYRDSMLLDVCEYCQKIAFGEMKK